MLKREIRYKNFDDEEVTESFYFNLSKPELLEMEVEVDGGLGRQLQRIVDESDNKKILAFFKKFILMSYGKKSEDGKQFIKSDELREAFSQTAAYEALFTEFMLDAKAGAEFVEGIMPKDLEEFNKKLQDQDKPNGPPASQTT